MRRVLPTLTCMGVMAVAAAMAGEPRAVPPERHEEISRVMLQLQQAQLAVSDAQRAFLEARAAYEKTQAQYQGLLAELQKEFEAPGCLLTLEKTWQCPKQQEPPAKPGGNRDEGKDKG